jgi:hypothetical protein
MAGRGPRAPSSRGLPGAYARQGLPLEPGDAAAGTTVSMTLVLVLLFAGGVGWATGAGVLSYGGAILVLALLPVSGYVSNRWIATLQAALLLVLAALVADVLVFGFELARQDEYEPLPTTPFAVLVTPVFMLLVAGGIGVRRLRERRRG